MINIFQQGGQMNDDQQAFTAYLIKILNPTDQRDFETKVSQLSEDDLKEYYKQFKTMEGNQISMAKLGAKLSYVQTLRGECPEGYEIEKYMAGGCVKCKKKAEGGSAVDVFKDKCGGKAKKRVKKNMGGTVDTSWTVPKNQKGSQINPNDTIHTKKGVRDLNGRTKYPKFNPKQATQQEKNRASEKDYMNTKKSGHDPSKPGKHYFGGGIQRRIIKQ